MCREDLDKLKKGLKITQFRAGQLACVEAIALQRADTWIQMPYGGGKLKSLVFAAVLNLKECIGLLVEPLNAIAGTMAPYLRDRGVDTLELTSDTRASVISRIRLPAGEGQAAGHHHFTRAASARKRVTSARAATCQHP